MGVTSSVFAGAVSPRFVVRFSSGFRRWCSRGRAHPARCAAFPGNAQGRFSSPRGFQFSGSNSPKLSRKNLGLVSEDRSPCAASGSLIKVGGRRCYSRGARRRRVPDPKNHVVSRCLLGFPGCSWVYGVDTLASSTRTLNCTRIRAFRGEICCSDHFLRFLKIFYCAERRLCVRSAQAFACDWVRLG